MYCGTKKSYYDFEIDKLIRQNPNAYKNNYKSFEAQHTRFHNEFIQKEHVKKVSEAIRKHLISVHRLYSRRVPTRATNDTDRTTRAASTAARTD